VVATTLRSARSATINDRGAVAWPAADGFAGATPRRSLEILDRVGGGDRFASGQLFGLLELGDLQMICIASRSRQPLRPPYEIGNLRVFPAYLQAGCAYRPY
jgi:sugar/nucleoside kinase (ribokinase family)